MGVDFSTDKRKGISLDTYVTNCFNRGYKNLWILRRLAELGVSTDKLMLTYNARIRVFAEENAPLWMFSVNKSLIKKIERLQKTSFYIILGKDADKEYLNNIKTLKTEPLEKRRQKLAINFASKILKHPEHRKIFSYKNDRTRSKKRVVITMTKRARYERTTIPSLAHIINEKLPHKI